MDDATLHLPLAVPLLTCLIHPNHPLKTKGRIGRCASKIRMSTPIHYLMTFPNGEINTAVLPIKILEDGELHENLLRIGVG
jgi:hypothetical protein